MKGKFITYYAAYKKESKPLNQMSDKTDVVILAFACPAPVDESGKSTKVTLDFLESVFTGEQLKEWVKEIKARGQKVMISIIDDPSTGWDLVDKDKFTKDLNNIINEWELDGVDIDAESHMGPDVYVNNFIELAQSLRRNISENKMISYTCYTGSEYDTQILNATRDLYENINLMAYFLDQKDMISLFNHYSSIVSPMKITIGVQVQVTPLEEVSYLTKWQPEDSSKYGMMLWTNNDPGSIDWINTIAQNLNKALSNDSSDSSVSSFPLSFFYSYLQSSSSTDSDINFPIDIKNGGNIKYLLKDCDDSKIKEENTTSVSKLGSELSSNPNSSCILL